MTNEELQLAHELLVRFFVEEGFATPPDQLRRNLEAFADDPGCHVALAWRDGHVVGVATVSATRSTEDGRVAEIQDLYVLPEQRGRGVARQLIDTASAWAASNGCSSLEVVVTPEAETQHHLGAFYSKLGFGATGRTIHSRRIG